MTLVQFLASLGVKLTQAQRTAVRGFEEGLRRGAHAAPSAPPSRPREEQVLVCSVCGTEACAAGDLYCEGFRSANMIMVPKSEAR